MGKTDWLDRLGACVGLLLILGLGSACLSTQPTDILRVQLGAEPVSLDPTLAEDGASLQILCNTMEGLVGYDGAGDLQNQIAEKVEISDDGKRYEFRLRPQARWSDGHPVRAQDFVLSFRRAVLPTSGARLAGMLFDIRGARGIAQGRAAPESLAVSAIRMPDGSESLLIELEKKSPYFLQALSLPVALPLREDILDAHGGKWPVISPSTGPYRLSASSDRKAYVLEKNFHYWRKWKENAPKTVRLLLLSDENAALNLFEQGSLDVLSKIPATELARISRSGRLRSYPFLATHYLAFNLAKRPFNDVKLRRAVSGAIQKQELIDALQTGESLAEGLIPPPLEGAGLELLPIDLRIKRLDLATLPTVQGYFDSGQRNKMIMEKVQADLQKNLGLKITLNHLDWKSYVKLTQTDPPQLFRMGILSPFLDPIQNLRSFTTADPNNYLRWSNVDYDRLVEEIARMSRGPDRFKKIRQAQQILVKEEAIIVPLYHYNQNYAIASRVHFFRANPFRVIRFNELEIL